MNTRQTAQMAFLFSAGIVFLGAALMVTAVVFDLEVLEFLFLGQPLENGLSRLWQRGPMTAGYYTVITGMVGLVSCGAVWLAITSLQGGDELYWWRIERDAKTLLKEQGIHPPTPLEICRIVLGLEEEQGGWRPESMLRYARSITDVNELDARDRLLVSRLKIDVKHNQANLDRTLGESGGDTTVLLAGKQYTAIELAELFADILVEVRRIDGYQSIDPTATPAPARRR